MTLVIQELNDESEYEEIGRVVDGEVTDEALYEIYPEEIWRARDEEWFLPRINGPYVMASQIEDEKEMEKERVYITHPDQAPEGVEVQEGARGGLYYEIPDWGEDVDMEEVQERAEEIEQIAEEEGVDLDEEVTADGETLGEKLLEAWSKHGESVARDLLHNIGDVTASVDPDTMVNTLDISMTLLGLSDEDEVDIEYLKKELRKGSAASFANQIGQSVEDLTTDDFEDYQDWVQEVEHQLNTPQEFESALNSFTEGPADPHRYSGAFEAVRQTQALTQTPHQDRPAQGYTDTSQARRHMPRTQPHANQAVKHDDDGLYVEKGDGVRLTFPFGGIPKGDVTHESYRDQYEEFFRDIEHEGGFAIDVKTTMNPDVENVVYPPDLPDDHDPRIEVFGVSRTTVEEIHDEYPGLEFDISVEPSNFTQKSAKSLDTVTTEVGGTEAEFYVANTDDKRWKGLSPFRSLDKDGMMFWYPEESLHRLVYRDMDFDLDVLFLDENMTVKHIGKLTPTHQSTEAVSKVAIEVERGWVEENDIEVGDQLAKTWVPYEGPSGGQGWVNSETGEVRYQEERPSEFSDFDDPREVVDQLEDLGEPEVISQIEDPEILTAMTEDFDEKLKSLARERAELDDSAEDYWEKSDEIRDQIREVKDARENTLDQMQKIASRAESVEDVEEIVEYNEQQMQEVRELDQASQEMLDDAYGMDDTERSGRLRDEAYELHDVVSEMESALWEIDLTRNLGESSAAEGEFDYENSQELREEMHQLHQERSQFMKPRQQLESVMRKAKRQISISGLQRNTDVSDDEVIDVHKELANRLSQWEEENIGPLKEQEEEIKERQKEVSEQLDQLKEEWFVEEVKEYDPEEAREELTGITGDEEPLELEDRNVEGDTDIWLNEAWNEWFSSPGGDTKQELIDRLMTEEGQRAATEELREAGIEEGDTVQVFRGGSANPDRGFDSWTLNMDEAETFARYGHGSIDTEQNMAHGLAMMAAGAHEDDIEDLADQIEVTEVPEEYILGYDHREKEAIVAPQPVPRGDLDD